MRQDVPKDLACLSRARYRCVRPFTRRTQLANGMANGYPPRSGNFSAMSVSEQRTTTWVPFQRTLGLFVLGVLCLGVLYLFFSSRRSPGVQDFDEEEGQPRDWWNASAPVTSAAVWVVVRVASSSLR